MKPLRKQRSGPRYRRVSVVVLLGALVLASPISSALAFPNPGVVVLGAADAFTVLAGATVTNTGATVISAGAGIGGNLGVSPGTAVTGFGPGVVTPPGTIHAGDATAATAQSAAAAAYLDAESRTPDVTFGPVYDLGGGQTFTPGVYNDPSSLAITGSVILDGLGDPDAVFIFQAGSTLVTAVSSAVLLINGTQACNVFWQVGSSATLGATSAFQGTILAYESASLNNAANVQGRVLAGAGAITGAVTLINDAIHTPDCVAPVGVSQAPLFGGLGQAVALMAFLAGASALIVRRRMHPVRTSTRDRAA
jgi:hypothetical protein